MEPVFVDIHIHTSENADKLNTSYNVEALKESIKKISKGNRVLISLSDHNTINKSAYLDLKRFFNFIIVGAELHIRNYQESPPYHAHILFNIGVNEEEINEVNKILDTLYPTKMVGKNPVHDIPDLENIVQKFENYDFLLLPHGGQAHSTFDCSIPKDTRFDTTMERSVYYNQFDGFTARSPEGMEKTIDYFSKLGIVEFINLITCSDNYNPVKYPAPKDPNASAFTPTWMLAEPTFEGLRISLSEKTRLVVSNDPPDYWQRCLRNVELNNERIDVKVDLLPGLNVVIGGSSTGKSLLVDSIYQSQKKSWDSVYEREYKVSRITVVNESNQVPHYIHQTYISELSSAKQKSIGEMDILKDLFPSQVDLDKKIDQIKNEVNTLVCSFFSTVAQIEGLEEKIRKIPVPTALLHDSSSRKDVISSFYPTTEEHNIFHFSSVDYEKYINLLNEIKSLFEKKPFTQDHSKEIESIKDELQRMHDLSKHEADVYELLQKRKKAVDAENEQITQETRSKISDHDQLIEYVKLFKDELRSFYNLLKDITTQICDPRTMKNKVGDYELSVEYDMEITESIFIEAVNNLFNKNSKITDLSVIKPDHFFTSKMRENLQSRRNYDEVSKIITNDLLKLNVKKYKVFANGSEDFDLMSPGKKSSIILDLILNYYSDSAPIIIDQPEDNLSKEYMTTKMIDAILQAKKYKQIIFVTHTASIPMLGDAQNIILCRNMDGKIVIRSAPLEGEIDGEKVVDYVVKITDGGKTAVKKRFKKYNMKSFVGEK